MATTPKSPRPYNPLEKRRLAESIVRELLSCNPGSLPPAETFLGSGIYAIYYSGDFPAYASLAMMNSEQCLYPIYVGQAAPPGARKGGIDEVSASPSLYKRLTDHGKSIQAASNLNLSDFQCRLLVVDDIWISLAEALLIESFRPVWNVALDGFGNHDPGAGRHQGKRPQWDTLHPGRPWAEKLNPNPSSVDELHARIQDHLRIALQR